MDADASQQNLFALWAVRAVTVRVSREFDVAPEQLFDAWLDPRIRDRFLPIACGSGVHVCFGERDRPRCLTFEAHLDGQIDHVTVELAPLEHGALLVLIHETGVHRAPDRAGLKAAWNTSLAVLEDNLEALRT